MFGLGGMSNILFFLLLINVGVGFYHKSKADRLDKQLIEVFEDVKRYEMQANNWELAIAAMQAEVKRREQENIRYAAETRERNHRIRTLNAKLTKVVKDNQEWANSVLPNAANSLVCEYEARTNSAAASDPAVCPPREVKPDDSRTKDRQDGRGSDPSPREFVASTGRMQRGQGSNKAVSKLSDIPRINIPARR